MSDPFYILSPGATTCQVDFITSMAECRMNSCMSAQNCASVTFRNMYVTVASDANHYLGS